MSDIVGSEVKSAACQKPKTGYENAHKFTEMNQAKNRVMAAQNNVITNKIKKTFTLEHQHPLNLQCEAQWGQAECFDRNE